MLVNDPAPALGRERMVLVDPTEVQITHDTILKYSYGGGTGEERLGQGTL